MISAQTQLFATPGSLDAEIYVINEERNGLSMTLFRISPSTARRVLSYLQAWLNGLRNVYSQRIADSILIQAFQVVEHNSNPLSLTTTDLLALVTPTDSGSDLQRGAGSRLSFR